MFIYLSLFLLPSIVYSVSKLPKLASIELVMPSNHLILCCPLLLLPSIFPNIRVFSNESALHIRWQCITSRIILWAEDKTCRGEGSRRGAQLGETVGSGSRWRKRLRGSYTTLQAETEINHFVQPRMKLHCP